MTEKPTLTYLQALNDEARAMIQEYADYKAGKITKTPEERKAWNEKKDRIHAEIRRVKALL